jgi:glutamate synthase (NADPH/NADH) small chain
VRALVIHEVERVDGRFQKIEGTERELPAQLVLLAMGFTGVQREGLVEALGVDVDGRGNVARDDEFMSTVPGVFVAGDAGRGQSLIVWGDRRGPRRRRRCRHVPHRQLHAARPVTPTAVALR